MVHATVLTLMVYFRKQPAPGCLGWAGPGCNMWPVVEMVL